MRISNKTLGNNIRAARKLRGMTLQQLAAHLGVSFQQLQKYERGHDRISAVRLYDIAQTLDFPINLFFSQSLTRDKLQPLGEPAKLLPSPAHQALPLSTMKETIIGDPVNPTAIFYDATEEDESETLLPEDTETESADSFLHQLKTLRDEIDGLLRCEDTRER